MENMIKPDAGGMSSITSVKGRYGTYPLITQLGEGTTSKVYKSELITSHKKKMDIVVKIIKENAPKYHPNDQQENTQQNLSYFFLKCNRDLHILLTFSYFFAKIFTKF